MLAQLGSYLGSEATDSGKEAVKTVSHSRQRSRCSLYTVAPRGACPITLTMDRGGES